MSIKTTRKCIDAILEGSIDNSEFTKDPIFGVDVPESLPDVDSTVLNPRNAWKNKDDYDKTADKLAGMFIKNFEKYAGTGSVDYTEYGPQLAK
eukprot:856982_1